MNQGLVVSFTSGEQWAKFHCLLLLDCAFIALAFFGS
jgi:hypothetical protein